MLDSNSLIHTLRDMPPPPWQIGLNSGKVVRRLQDLYSMCLKAVWKVCGGCLDGNLRKVVIQLNLVENLSKLTRFLSKFVYYKKGKVGFLTKFTGFCPNLKINIKFFRNYSGYNEGTKKILAHSLSGTGD